MAYKFKVSPQEIDLISELYLVLHNKLGKHQKQISNFSAWFRVLIHNYLIDCLRKKGSAEKFLEWKKNRDYTYEVDIFEMLDQRELTAVALSVVNQKEAECLVERYLLEKSYKEIAKSLDLSDKQVAGRIQRGLAKMRDHFGKRTKAVG